MAGEVLNQLKACENSLEDYYPLSPLQQGMLFDHLGSAYPGVNIEQIIGTLPEPVEFVAFRQAWERAVERHAILRTGFRWDGLEEPRQEVHRRVRLRLELRDWRGVS